MFFFFKQKTAYEMRISDWSSDVCSSDLLDRVALLPIRHVWGRHRGRRKFQWSVSSRIGRGQKIVWLVRSGSESGKNARRKRPWAQIGRASCRERVCQYV